MCVSVKMWVEQFGMIDSCMFYVFCAAVFVVVLLAVVAMFAGCCLQDLSWVTLHACPFLILIACFSLLSSATNFVNFADIDTDGDGMSGVYPPKAIALFLHQPKLIPILFTLPLSSPYSLFSLFFISHLLRIFPSSPEAVPWNQPRGLWNAASCRRGLGRSSQHRFCSAVYFRSYAYVMLYPKTYVQ